MSDKEEFPSWVGRPPGWGWQGGWALTARRQTGNRRSRWWAMFSGRATKTSAQALRMRIYRSLNQGTGKLQFNANSEGL
jgi:hypothetical protein